MKIPSKCPCCDGSISIASVKCNKCGTKINNNFELSVFDKLSTEQVSFLMTFIKAEGNIKEIEKELGISYPTVKNRLNVIKETLFSKLQKETYSQHEVLDMLEKGEISTQDAIDLIKK